MNTTTTFAATIGLDWADQKHDLWIRPADGGKAQHLRLEQTPEALHEWVAKLRERFGNRPIAIGIETSRGPVISALMAYDFIVLFPVNPKAMKDYRAAFSVSGAKDDRTDAQLLEEFVRLHRDKLKALEPDTELTRMLAGLVENRRHLVDERTRIVNQLHSILKTYYPLAETLLGRQMNQPIAADFLSRWPDLESLKKAGPEKLRAFCYKHNSRNSVLIEQRLAALEKATALTTDQAIITPARLLVVALANILKPLHQAIARLDKEIEQAMNQHPDAPIFRSFPAAGPALAPRLLVAFGTNRDRFEDADEVAQFYGLAPVVKPERQLQNRSPSLPLSQVRPPDLPRKRRLRCQDRTLGQMLLCPTKAKARRQASPGLPLPGLQADPHLLRLLEEPHHLRCGHLPPRAGKTGQPTLQKSGNPDTGTR